MIKFLPFLLLSSCAVAATTASRDQTYQAPAEVVCSMLTKSVEEFNKCVPFVIDRAHTFAEAARAQ